MKQTAVEWLIEELNDNGFSHLDLAADIIEQAKEMEKENIKQAYNDGKAAVIHIENNMSLDEYYNKTYKNETK
jgi:hypothetical protein